jgi:hypothetical protein
MVSDQPSPNMEQFRVLHGWTPGEVAPRMNAAGL